MIRGLLPVHIPEVQEIIDHGEVRPGNFVAITRNVVLNDGRTIRYDAWQIEIVGNAVPGSAERALELRQSQEPDSILRLGPALENDVAEAICDEWGRVIGYRSKAEYREPRDRFRGIWRIDIIEN